MKRSGSRAGHTSLRSDSLADSGPRQESGGVCLCRKQPGSVLPGEAGSPLPPPSPLDRSRGAAEDGVIEVSATVSTSSVESARSESRGIHKTPWHRLRAREQEGRECQGLYPPLMCVALHSGAEHSPIPFLSMIDRQPIGREWPEARDLACCGEWVLARQLTPSLLRTGSNSRQPCRLQPRHKCGRRPRLRCHAPGASTSRPECQRRS